MLRLTERQRTALSESLRTLASLMVTAFVFTDLVMQPSPSFRLIATGIVGWFVLLAAALYLIGEQ